MDSTCSQQLFTAGSAGSGQLLLNLNDRHEFLEVDLKQNFPMLPIRKLRLNGMYGMCLCITEIGSKSETLMVWGDPFDSKNGIIPKPIPLRSEVTQFSCGWQHALMLCGDTVYGIGSNKFNELGLKGQSSFAIPTRIASHIENPRKVVAGFRQSAVLTSNSSLYGCGSSRFGELSTESLEDFTFLLGDVKNVKLGQKFMLIQTNANELYGQGANNFSQLAQPSATKRVTLTLLNTKVIRFACGWSHHLVVRSEAPFVQAAGRNDMGQLGVESDCLYPIVDVPGIEKCRTVKCGSDSSYLIFDDCVLMTGWNEHGNLAIGSTDNVFKWTPFQFIWHSDQTGGSSKGNKLKVGGASVMLLKN